MVKIHCLRQLLYVAGPYPRQRHQALSNCHGNPHEPPCSEMIRGPVNQDEDTNKPARTHTPQVKSNELHVFVTPISKLYTDNTGRFLVHVRSGNRYIMIAYHCDDNLILAESLSSRKDAHILLAYNKIMQRLTNNNLYVELHILDNEASEEYKRSIKNK